MLVAYSVLVSSLLLLHKIVHKAIMWLVIEIVLRSECIAPTIICIIAILWIVGVIMREGKCICCAIAP